MTWDNRYRRLNEGEVILPGDEVEMDSPYGWQPAVCVYQPAPDPSYTAHRVYRRSLPPTQPEAKEARDGIE